MRVGEQLALATWSPEICLCPRHRLLWELPGTPKPTSRGVGSRWWASSILACEACTALCPRMTRAGLPVPCRPFIKLKENGRANISRSSSSTSSFSSTAGEGEVMEECDSGVGVALSNPGEQEGTWAQPDTSVH